MTAISTEQDVFASMMEQLDTPYVIVILDDDVNTTEYVTRVFMSYFELSNEVAITKMLEVHEQGRSVLDSGTYDEMKTGSFSQRIGQQPRNLRSIDHGATRKGIDQHRSGLRPHSDQHVAGRVESVRNPADAARRGDIKNRQAHRKTPPPVQHFDEIGIDRIIIALAVAVEAEVSRQHLRQRVRLFLGSGGSLSALAELLRDLLQESPEIAQIQTRMVECGKLQCGDIQNDGFLVEQAEMGNFLNHEGPYGQDGFDLPAISCFSRYLAMPCTPPPPD